MAKKVKKGKRTVSSSSPSRSKRELSPIMQVGVVFVIVAAMLLLMYVGRITQ